MAKLVLKKSTYKSDELDYGSILLLQNLFFKCGVKERLEGGGNLPMIDGYLELLNNDGVMEAKITVQVKHLTCHPTESDAYYDIPNEVFAYANLNKGEVVIFVACDTNNKTFYWRYIDSNAIQSFINLPNECQQTQRYHFAQSEKCDETCISQTLVLWKKIFDDKMTSFKDEKCFANQFVEVNRTPFAIINSLFYGLPESHIRRHEVDVLLDWTNEPLSENQANLCVLQGNAGVGKSVVIKDFIEELDKQKIKTLCIKADSLNLMSEDIKLDKLISYIQYIKADQRLLVVVIDQIDALSQYLSNDRDKINLFVTLLSNLKEYKDIRIVVSCRKYDLEYDNKLQSLCYNAKQIELGYLSEEEVRKTIDMLCEGLNEKLDFQTIKLLQTAHLLNLFCFVHRKNSQKLNYRNAHQLYDELWELLIDNAPKAIAPSDIEGALFKIASSALNQKTLSPIISGDDKEKIVFDYLASNHAILVQNMGYSFFHQSFYDYTLARFFTSRGGSFFDKIQKSFQGIEIRSTVKAVLEFDKEHNLNNYSNDLRLIFNSSKIREHIKLLTLSLIAMSEEVSECEREAVFNTCSRDMRCLSFFLRGVHNDKWFTTLKTVVLPLVCTLNPKSELLYPIANYLSVASFRHVKEVFEIINQNEDKAVQSYFINVVLRGHNDYRRSFVRDALLTSNIDYHFYIHALIDALQTNKEFVFAETERLILNYLLKNDNQGNKHDSYVLVEDLCKKLAEEYSIDYLTLFHRVFLSVIEKKSKPHYLEGFTLNEVFGYNIKDYDRKLLNMYKRLLVKYSSDTMEIKQMIKDIYKTNNECAVCLAFEIMSLNPSIYNDEILCILNDTEKMDSYLCGDIEYYFLLLLRNWYLVQDSNQKSLYENLILNYKSKNDRIINKHRDFDRRLYTYLWHNKWKLISVTIPENIDNANLRRCRHELNRRNSNKPYSLNIPDHSVHMAEICGGSLREEQYTNLSFSRWLDLFAVEDNHWHYNRKPVDIRVNAKMFKECVSKNPRRFVPFVFGLFTNNSIKVLYKIEGVKGLLDGGMDIDVVWPYAKQFLDVDFVRNNPHDFTDIMQYYFEFDNEHIDEIVLFLKSVAILLEEERQGYNSMQGFDALEKRVNTKLTKALNSCQGKSVELIIKLCGIEQRKNYGYQLINEIEPLISEDTRLLVVHYIYDNRFYDEELTRQTFNSYIKRLSSEVLYLNLHAIQYYWYHNPEIVTGFIDIIEKDVHTHKILAEINFYGLIVPNRADECKRRLEKLLCLDEEEVVANLIKVCLKNFKHKEYTHLCEDYLRRFSKDGRESVIHSYCWYAKELPVNAFDLFLDIYSCFRTNKYRDISDELKYIKECVIIYPQECLDFIQSQNYDDNEISHFVNEEITEILLMIYKRLKEDEDMESINRLLLFFEKQIYIGGNRKINDVLLSN